MYKNSATARLPLSLWNAIVARSLATSVRRSRPVDEVSREARRDLVSPLARRSVMGAARDRAHADGSASAREDLDAAYESFVFSRGGARAIRKILIANNGRT